MRRSDIYIKAAIETIAIFIAAVILCAIVGALFSCTRKVYVPVERTHTEYQRIDTASMFAGFRTMLEAVTQKDFSFDSIVEHSRETVVINEKGDTIRHDTNRMTSATSRREKELEREVERKDSIIENMQVQLESVKVDSIPIPYPVERNLTPWEKTKIELGGIAIGATLLLIVVVTISAGWAIKHRKKQ